ncbi:MAG: hypothetical protein VX278_23610 [Myxococcota bacterium]|nr:hypothetical protein [Myxococcota bacterium]
MSSRKKRIQKRNAELERVLKPLAHFKNSDPKGKKRGPVTARAVRKHGDPRYADMLGEALSKQGKIDRATHGFHTYPAGMHPDCARIVIEACPGAVHDPFCGGGTVLVESMLAGRQTSGSDLSPIALLVSAARCSSPSMATPMRSAARKIAAQAQLRIEVEVHETLVEWYEPHVAQELGRIRDEIPKYDEAVQPLLRALLSCIAVKCSYRKSDTSNKREVQHRPVGTTATLFHKKAREFGRMLEKMPEATPKIYFGDACQAAPPHPVDLILTSPPYPGVYDYLPLQQLRYLWLDISDTKSKLEIGSRRNFRIKGRKDALKEWHLNTDRWIQTQAQKLNPGGKMAIIVGDGLVGNKLVDALFPTVEAMKSAGMRIVARASADRPDHARNAIRIEHLVLAEKESAS